jgi:DNA-binding response OmpR family regulator
MNRLLLIEDDSSLVQSVSRFLLAENYSVHVTQSLAEAAEAIRSFNPEVILLDWMLPDGQGIDFLRSLRTQDNAIPVILLTARADVIDKVLGLETGANDYLTKPFEPRELLARIRVQLRLRGKQETHEDTTLRVGPILVQYLSRSVTIDGRSIDLTRMEFELLRLLCENPNRVYSRDELLNKVWGYQNFPTTRTVDTHILQLRTKCGERFFETVRGVGYRLKI